MRVLLVYPKFPKTFWSFDKVLELVGRKVLLPPLGLITVAALLPQHWEFQLVDCNLRDVSEAEWAWADMVILSAMLVQKRDLAAQIRLAKDHGLPVAVGGPFASSTPDAPELKLADFKVLDEGEITLPAFVAALQRGEKSGRFHAEGEKPDITVSPVPRFDLLELDAYDSMAVQFSRGCPFQCEFCDIIVLYGRKPRTKTPDQLLGELDALYGTGWRGQVFLVDDNFIGNKRNVKLLLPQLHEWQCHHDFPFSFVTEASVDLASDADLLDRMAACRFRSVFLGIETPDTSSLATASKLQNTRTPLDEAVAVITSYGIQVMAGFIIGFDGEKSGAGDRIVNFVNATGIPVAMVGVLQALPDTGLWHRLEKEGRLQNGAFRFDEGVQTNLLNFHPSRPMAEIGAEFVEAFTQLYEPRGYLDRVFSYCKALGLPRWRREPGMGWRWWTHMPRRGELTGLLTLIWRQGVKRESRWLFWRYLIRMMLERPQLLEEYLRLALLNEHFLDYREVVRDQVAAQLEWTGGGSGGMREAEGLPVVS